MRFGDEKAAKRIFKELPFCNAFIEKPYTKRLII